MAGKFELSQERVGIIVIDIQERLAGTMPDKVLKGTLRNWLNLIETARVLGLPVAVSEQDSRSLGRSLPVVGESVLRLPRDATAVFQKQTFSALAAEAFAAWLKRSGRKQWLVAGMETHVAVFQTVRDLVATGHAVHVPRDAVISRTMPNWEIGLKLMEQCGAIITSTETAVFDLLKESGSEAFRSLSRTVK